MLEVQNLCHVSMEAKEDIDDLVNSPPGYLPVVTLVWTKAKKISKQTMEIFCLNKAGGGVDFTDICLKQKLWKQDVFMCLYKAAIIWEQNYTICSNGRRNYRCSSSYFSKTIRIKMSGPIHYKETFGSLYTTQRILCIVSPVRWLFSKWGHIQHIGLLDVHLIHSFYSHHHS